MTEEKFNNEIQELQILEQSLQGFLMEKQTFQVELNESLNAMEELNKSEGDVFKILGNVMLKSDKGQLIEDLMEKKKILELRISSLEKQEKLTEGKISNIRSEISSQVSNKNKN